jgi:site-specific DNA recombinase
MKNELFELNSEKTKYADYRKDLDKYVSFGLTVFTNLDTYFQNAPVNIKLQLLGSYFTDKLIFDKNKFRTLPFNNTILLLSKYNKDFRRSKKEEEGFFSKTSLSVPGAGLEPARSQ